MKDRSQLSDNYIKQSNFMERIKFALRGQTNGEQMLEQSKLYCIVTLK